MIACQANDGLGAQSQNLFFLSLADLVMGLKSTIGAPLLAAYVAVKRSEAARFKDASHAEEQEILWHRY